MKNKAIISDLLLFELLAYESFQQRLIQLNKNFEKLITNFLEQNQNKRGQARLDFLSALTRELPNWQSWILNVVADIKKQHEIIQLVEAAKFIDDVDPVTKKPIIKVQIDTPRVLSPVSIKNNIMDIKGPVIWKKLHTYALSWDGNVDAHTAFIEDTTRQIACGECKQFWLNYKKETPPPTDSKENFFAWTVELHNKVNIKLNKPTMELAEAIELYKS